jgi:hypothetical protein
VHSRRDFARPIVTFSLQSDGEVCFGEKVGRGGVQLQGPGRMQGNSISLPRRSLLVLDDETAAPNEVEHGVPPATAPRISITLRRRS